MIRAVYHGAPPSFPATDQHPDAVRYGPFTIGGDVYFADAIGEPTADDVAAIVQPRIVPQVISDRQFFQQLATMGVITQDDALAAVKTGTLPPALVQLVAALPADQQFGANMLLCGATSFERSHPMVAVLGQAFGWNSAQLDALWTAAFAL